MNSTISLPSEWMKLTISLSSEWMKFTISLPSEWMKFTISLLSEWMKFTISLTNNEWNLQSFYMWMNEISITQPIPSWDFVNIYISKGQFHQYPQTVTITPLLASSAKVHGDLIGIIMYWQKLNQAVYIALTWPLLFFHISKYSDTAFIAYELSPPQKWLSVIKGQLLKRFL